jgi:hypothetical protein
MSLESQFSHPPLDLESRQIRLLQILYDDSQGSISCCLKTYNSVDANEYVALSYTWGCDHPTYSIMINGDEFSVRQNLWDFLLVAKDRFVNTLFWIEYADPGYSL